MEKSLQIRNSTAEFLTFVLDNAGEISPEFAKQFAESEYEKYRNIQDRLFESDFDRFNQNLLEFPDDIQ